MREEAKTGGLMLIQNLQEELQKLRGKNSNQISRFVVLMSGIEEINFLQK